MDIDEAFSYAGSWGRYQKILYVVLFLAAIPNALTVMHFVFSNYVPDFHCALPEVVQNYTENSTDHADSLLDYIIPNVTDKSGEVVRSQCEIYLRNYSQYPIEDWPIYFNTTAETTSCSKYIFHAQPHQTSAAIEFSMVCDRDWLAHLVITIFMVGMALGSLSASLADRFGRRPVFLAADVVQVLAMAATTLCRDYYSYAALSFMTGMSSLLNYIIAFVVATEITSEKRRNFMTIGSFFPYAVGYCIVALMGFLFQNWKWNIGMMSLLSALIYLPSYWLFPESPRWLIQKGRKEEALKLMRKIAKSNGRLAILEKELEGKDEGLISKDEIVSAGVLQTLKTLFNSGIGKRCAAVLFMWFSTSLVYFSISYFTVTFSEDRFLNVFFGALSEFPAYFLSYYAVDYIGRPRSVTLLMTIAGISSIVLPFVPQDLHGVKTTLSMFGKAGVAGVFYIAYMMSSEIAPTLERSSFMSISSFTARIGSLICPFLMYLAKVQPALPNLLMGCISLSCAVMSVAAVPETKGITMPDTMDEARANNRFYGLNLCKRVPNVDRMDYKKGRLSNRETKM